MDMVVKFETHIFESSPAFKDERVAGWTASCRGSAARTKPQNSCVAVDTESHVRATHKVVGSFERSTMRRHCRLSAHASRECVYLYSADGRLNAPGETWDGVVTRRRTARHASLRTCLRDMGHVRGPAEGWRRWHRSGAGGWGRGSVVRTLRPFSARRSLMRARQIALCQFALMSHVSSTRCTFGERGDSDHWLDGFTRYDNVTGARNLLDGHNDNDVTTSDTLINCMPSVVCCTLCPRIFVWNKKVYTFWNERFSPTITFQSSSFLLHDHYNDPITFFYHSLSLF